MTTGEITTEVMNKIVFKTEWFEVIQSSIKQFKKPYYTIKTNDAVVILALTKNKEVILVKQYRPAFKSYILELPSGGKNSQELFSKTAERELYEETGYQSSRVVSLGNDFPIMSDRITRKVNFFVAFECEKNQNTISEKDIETILVDQSSFEELIKKNEFKHIAGITAFALAKWHNYL